MEHGNGPRFGAIRRHGYAPRAANRGPRLRGRGMGRGRGFHRPPGSGGHGSIPQQQGCQTPAVLDVHPGAAPICSRYQTRSGCLGHNCGRLHICRNFLAGICMFGERCSELHRLAGSHNQAVCDQYLPDLDMEADQDLLLWRLRRGVLATLTERDACRSLKLCLQFSSRQGCNKTDCNRLHVCRRLVEGGCTYGDRCFYTHTLLLPESRVYSPDVLDTLYLSGSGSGRGQLDDAAAQHNTTIMTNLGLQDLPQDKILCVLIDNVENRASEARLQELVPIDCETPRYRPPNSARAHGENVPGLPSTESCRDGKTVNSDARSKTRRQEVTFAAAAAGSVQKAAEPPHEERAAERPEVSADVLKALVDATSGEMEAKLTAVAEQIQARSMAAMANAESKMAASAAALAAQSAALETKSTAISDELKCPICLEYLREAINTGCGHSFCKGCLEQLKRHAGGLYRTKCPQCRKDITSETRSFALDSVIRQLKQ